MPPGACPSRRSPRRRVADPRAVARGVRAPRRPGTQPASRPPSAMPDGAVRMAVDAVGSATRAKHGALCGPRCPPIRRAASACCVPARRVARRMVMSFLVAGLSSGLQEVLESGRPVDAGCAPVHRVVPGWSIEAFMTAMLDSGTGWARASLVFILVRVAGAGLDPALVRPLAVPVRDGASAQRHWPQWRCTAVVKLPRLIYRNRLIAVFRLSRLLLLND